MTSFFVETYGLNWIAVASILVYLLYRYSTATFHHWKDKGVPYVTPIPFFGNTMKTICLIQPLELGLKDLYDRLSPHPFGGIYDLRKPILIARDPELLKHIMIKDFNHFHDRGFPYNGEVEPLSANLVNIEGEQWKNLRCKLTPAFSSGKLKQMFELIVECSEGMKQYLNNKIEVDGPIVECKSLTSKFSTDVIGSCTLGISCNCMSDENSEFTRIGNILLGPSGEFALRRIVRFFLPKVADVLNIKDIPPEVTNFFLRITRETLRYREKHHVVRNDFMELLKQLKNKGRISDEPGDSEMTSDSWSSSDPLSQEMKTKENPDMVMDNSVLAAQAYVFFIAGFETTGGALTFCLHELSINPEIQSKLREEIISMLHETDGKFIYENVNSLQYLEKVICETLRKYPTAGHTLRKVTKRYIIPGTNVRLDVGDLVIISMLGLHRDPNLYPDPENFDPERFSKEEMAKRHPCAFLPFGTGPRACIGMRFAMLEMKVALITLMSQFKFEVCSRTQHPLQFDSSTIFMAVKDGAWLKVSKLNNGQSETM